LWGTQFIFQEFDMTRFKARGAASAILLSGAAILAACASSGGNQMAAQSQRAQEQPGQSEPAQEVQTFTDAQIAAYAAAFEHVNPIARASVGADDAEQLAAAQQVQTILARNNIDLATYNAIAAQAQTDQALANRISAERVSTVTEADLRAFVAASREIDPIGRAVVNGTEAQRQEAAVQINAILARNNMDAATYNGIAARAQNEPALAARINSIQSDMAD